MQLNVLFFSEEERIINVSLSSTVLKLLKLTHTSSSTYFGEKNKTNKRAMNSITLWLPTVSNKQCLKIDFKKVHKHETIKHIMLEFLSQISQNPEEAAVHYFCDD